MVTPAEVHDFWFPARIDRPAGMLAVLGRWSAGAPTDEAIRARFLSAIEAGLSGGLGAWEDTVEGRIALVVLLDQFPRHAFRGTPRQWAGDARALKLTEALVTSGEADAAPVAQALTLVFPMLHSEELAVHDGLGAFAARTYDRMPDYAAEVRPGLHERAAFYRSLLERYGRYPFRNTVLGRESTPEEQAFLEDFELGPPRGFVPFMQRLHRAGQEAP